MQQGVLSFYTIQTRAYYDLTTIAISVSVSVSVRTKQNVQREQLMGPFGHAPARHADSQQR